jgi:hypothetical protein
MDKDFSSKLPTTQLLIPFSIIHHAQHGIMLECSHAPKYQDAPGGIDEGEGPLGIEVQGKPMLGLIGMEPEEGPTDRPARPEAIVKKC